MQRAHFVQFSKRKPNHLSSSILCDFRNGMLCDYAYMLNASQKCAIYLGICMMLVPALASCRILSPPRSTDSVEARSTEPSNFAPRLLSHSTIRVYSLSSRASCVASRQSRPRAFFCLNSSEFCLMITNFGLRNTVEPFRIPRFCRISDGSRAFF